MELLLESLSQFIIRTIELGGYGGIFFLMLLESANLPVPSEIIMPFSGYLVFEEKLVLWYVVLAGALGNLTGSLLSYLLGWYGGRPFVERYGKFLFISSRDIQISQSLFSRYGTTVIFFSRMLPVVRTFISFPAGMAKMEMRAFLIWTFAGSFLWSYILTYAGVVAGANWRVLAPFFQKFDWAIAAGGVILVVWWIYRHIQITNEK